MRISSLPGRTARRNRPEIAYIPTPHKLEALAKGEDLRDEVPDLVPYLQTGDRVINVEYLPIARPTKYPSALQALDQLTGLGAPEEHRQLGPILAALPTHQNAKIDELQLFEVMFGRDSERVSLDLLDHYPRLAEVTIMRLAELQGVKVNHHSGEEPGRIIHEYRNPRTDKLARQLTREVGWEWPYYESIDSTPLFITLIKRYCKQEGNEILSRKFTGRDGKVHQIADALADSLDWLRRRLDAHPEGLLEYRRHMGIAAETWRDSWDSFSHHNGTIANHEFGVAAVEVQALAYDALLDAARVYEWGIPRPGKVVELKERADRLAGQIMSKFWTSDRLGGYFVIGLDHDRGDRLHKLAIKSSDMGHLLNSRLLDGADPRVAHRREAIIRHLFAPDLLAASGIRTLSSLEKRFCPGGYHTGSVWLWETYYIAQGLERQGYYGLSQNLKERIWRVVDTTRKFPEFARGGFEPEPLLTNRIVDVCTAKGFHYRLEQPPQEIQAWTVAAIVASKTKRDPNHPDRPVPIQAPDPAKRAFEREILRQITN